MNEKSRKALYFYAIMQSSICIRIKYKCLNKLMQLTVNKDAVGTKTLKDPFLLISEMM